MRTHYRRLVSIFIVLVFTSLSFPSFASEQQDADFLALDKAIEEVLREGKVPSVAYAVFHSGQEPTLRVLGVADLETEEPVTFETQYRIASISKTIVGIAVMQLVEQGKISLIDKVSEVLPQLEYTNPWADTHPLKVVHLLESTTGWDEIALKEFNYHNNPPLDLASALAYNPSSRVSRWPPGTRHAYTNSAAAASARLVETVTGMSFYSYASQFIFAPLGINSATFDEPNARAATGYKKGQAVPFDYILMKPAGSVILKARRTATVSRFYCAHGAI